MAGENTNQKPQNTPAPKPGEAPAVETPAVETPAATPADEFQAVFDALNTLGDKSPPEDLTSKPIESAAAVQEAAKPTKPVRAIETPAAEEPAAGDDELPADDQQKREAEIAAAEAAAAAPANRKPANQPAAAEVDDDEILRRLGRLLKQPEQPVQQQPQRPAAQTFDFNDDERAVVEDYEKEWPDVARAEAIKRGREYKLLTQHIFSEVLNLLAPVYEGQRALLDRTQLADLQQSVENYDEQLVNDVAEWVKTQPAYLQPAYVHVMQQGTVEEVKDLVDRYRQATGGTTKETPAPTTKPVGTELPTPAKQAAARLAPVSTKRSAPVQAPSKDDFDGAFAEAAKEA